MTSTEAARILESLAVLNASGKTDVAMSLLRSDEEKRAYVATTRAKSELWHVRGIS